MKSGYFVLRVHFDLIIAAYYKDMEDERRYTNVLLEDINSKFDLLIEIILPMSKTVKQLQQDITQVTSDVTVIKKVVRDHSGTLHNHKYRITRLESA